jgi:hypothetical protein
MKIHIMVRQIKDSNEQSYTLSNLESLSIMDLLAMQDPILLLKYIEAMRKRDRENKNIRITEEVKHIDRIKSLIQENQFLRNTNESLKRTNDTLSHFAERAMKEASPETIENLKSDNESE